jgi:hypothetical protein
MRECILATFGTYEPGNHNLLFRCGSIGISNELRRSSIRIERVSGPTAGGRCGGCGAVEMS